MAYNSPSYSSPLKIAHPKRKYIFQPPIFRGELLVSGRVSVSFGLFWWPSLPCFVFSQGYIYSMQLVTKGGGGLWKSQFPLMNFFMGIYKGRKVEIKPCCGISKGSGLISWEGWHWGVVPLDSPDVFFCSICFLRLQTFR